MSHSPWGNIQDRTIFACGIGSVSTPGHGGFYITHTAASERRISPPATSRAINQGGCYWFEEDCQWAILALECPELWNEMFKHSPAEVKADIRAYLIRTISAWDADYLLERGIEPEPKAFAYWQENQLQDKMRRERHPDLIVCASGASSFNPDIPEGAVKVTTADDKDYLVTEASYDARTERGGLNLLSKCQPYVGALVRAKTEYELATGMNWQDIKALHAHGICPMD